MNIMGKEIASWIVIIIFLLLIVIFLIQQLGSESLLINTLFDFFEHDLAP